MSITNLILLQDVVEGVPSGNYDGSSLAFDSDGIMGVGYYRGQGSIQTARIAVTGFQGLITLQATLDQNWQAAAWFDVYEFGDPDAPITDIHPVALTGNFTWIRAKITDFTAGTINSIIVSY